MDAPEIQTRVNVSENCYISSKTIISVYTLPEAGASRDTAGQTGVNVAENCCKFSIFINPQSPHAGVDARAPRMYVVQSFCTSL
jgi:hypothetical protein